MPTKSKEVATTASGTARETLNRTFAEAAESMRAADASGDEMLLSILDLGSVDDILSSGANQAVGLQEMLGVPFTIKRAELRESDYEDGLAAYLVMFSETDDGEALVITSGAQTVIAQVVRMNQLGALPVRCQGVKASKATAAGYYPVSLTKAPDAAQLKLDNEQF